MIGSGGGTFPQTYSCGNGVTCNFAAKALSPIITVTDSACITYNYSQPTVDLKAIILKGGTVYTVYSENSIDGNLCTAINVNGNLDNIKNYYDLSNVVFCFTTRKQRRNMQQLPSSNNDGEAVLSFAVSMDFWINDVNNSGSTTNTRLMACRVTVSALAIAAYLFIFIFP
jgi:hypothetical protein